MQKIILNRFSAVTFIIILLTTPFTASAQENTEEIIRDLKYQVKVLQDKLSELKGSCESQSSTSMTSDTNDSPEIAEMKERMNRLFADNLQSSGAVTSDQTEDLDLFFEPKVDIDDQKDYYLIKADLPGMDKSKIHVEVGEHFIKISGERAFEATEQKDENGSYQTDRSFGSFSRQLSIPENIVVENVDAKYENGVLTVRADKKTAPKNAKSTAQKVEIQ